MKIELEKRFGSRKTVLVSWVLGFLFLTIYLAFPNVNNNWDAVGWAAYLEDYASADGPIFFATSPPPVRDNGSTSERRHDTREYNPGWWILWNPHHLIYLPITATLFRLIRQIVPMLGGITFLQWWNSLASALIMVFLYRLLQGIFPRNGYALPWCIFLGTSVSFFSYATDGTQYPSSILFLVLGCAAMKSYIDNRGRKAVLQSAICFALAVLFHQIAVLAIPFISAMLFVFIRQHSDRNGKMHMMDGWIFPTVAFGIILLVYLVVGAFALIPTGEFNIAGILKYSTLYAHQDRFWTTSILNGFLVNLLTFVGFYFGTGRIYSHMFVQPVVSVIILILPAIWIASIINARRYEFDKRWWIYLSMLWIFPYLVFLSLWTPGHDFYHLFLIVPLSILSTAGSYNVEIEPKRQFRDTLLFWIWCLSGVILNLPVGISKSIWFASH